MTPSDSQGHRREPGAEAHEDDPTGIRDLLASLPDPGPMPEHLVERIGARLAVEQAHREQGSTGGLAARSDSAIDLAAERSHRRPGRTVALLGAAAAGLLVATVAIGELAGVGPAGSPAFDSAAQVPARSNGPGADGADSGGGADEEMRDAGGAESLDEAADGEKDLAGGGTEAGAGAEAFGNPFSADVVVLPQLGVVDPTEYRDRIVELASDSSGPQVAAATSLTEAGARWCWQTVDAAAPWPTLHAAQAEMDGRRVVVLLGMRDAGTGEALVLPWACTTGEEVDPLDATVWGP